jgi:mannose-6-phosphate isomerase
MYRLDCKIQTYDWGRIGADSKVSIYKKSQTASFQIDPNGKYAELWMGTHSNGPSTLRKLDGSELSLSDHLKTNPKEIAGEVVLKHFYESEGNLVHYGDLPFLFKVLSINKALSIQAHPNQHLGAILHKNDPAHYPDSNHKPEMLIALTDFEAMCGFREHSQIVKHFNEIVELRNLCGEANVSRFCSLSKDVDGELQKEALKSCINSMMKCDKDFISEQFKSIQCHLLTKKEVIDEEAGSLDLNELFVRLSNAYPDDVGCFWIYFLNCFRLCPGESIFLAANVPHAYLLGDGVECMACSDNVVRAGLTPKFKDVEILCEMLDYTMSSIEQNKLRPIHSDLFDYLDDYKPANIDEFSVQRLLITSKHIENKKRLLMPASAS